MDSKNRIPEDNHPVIMTEFCSRVRHTRVQECQQRTQRASIVLKPVDIAVQFCPADGIPLGDKIRINVPSQVRHINGAVCLNCKMHVSNCERWPPVTQPSAFRSTCCELLIRDACQRILSSVWPVQKLRRLERTPSTNPCSTMA